MSELSDLSEYLKLDLLGKRLLVHLLLSPDLVSEGDFASFLKAHGVRSFRALAHEYFDTFIHRRWVIAQYDWSGGKLRLRSGEAAELITLVSLEDLSLSAALWARSGLTRHLSRWQEENRRDHVNFIQACVRCARGLQIKGLGQDQKPRYFFDSFYEGKVPLLSILSSDERFIPLFKAIPAPAVLKIVAGIEERKKNAMSLPVLSALLHRADLEDETRAHLVRSVFLFGHLVREGHPEKLEEAAAPFADSQQTLVWLNLVRSLIAGKPEASRKNLMAARKLMGVSKIFEEPLLDLLSALALYADRLHPASFKKMESILASRDAEFRSSIHVRLLCLLGTGRDCRETISELQAVSAVRGMEEWLATFFAAVVAVSCHLMDSSLLLKMMENRGFLAACPLYELFAQSALDPESARVKELSALLGMASFIPRQEKKEEWKQHLDQMLQRLKACQRSHRSEAGSAGQRIIYFVDTVTLNITPKKQTSRDGVNWSSGKAVSLGAFSRGIDGMSERDYRVAKFVESTPRLYLGGEAAIAELVDYPYVYKDGTVKEPLKISAEPLQLSVRETESGGYEVTDNIDVDDLGPRSIYVVPKGTRELAVIRVSEEQKEIISAFERMPTFPAEAKKALSEALMEISPSVPVMSDLIAASEKVQTIAAESKVTFRFEALDAERFSAKAIIRPLAESDVLCTPGRGLAFISAEAGGATVRVERDLQKEKDNFSSLGERLHEFDECRDGEFVWIVDFEQCLQLLETLRPLADLCSIEWPRGASLKVSYAPVQSGSVHLSLRSLGQWLEVNGEVRLSDKMKLSVAELLEKARESRYGFISLGESEYVALTEQLRKQLRLLDEMLTHGRKGNQLSMYSAPALQKMQEEGLDIEADGEYRNLLERIEQANALEIELPKGLDADLREYQVSGFEWMSRLAHWKAGGCLADDMGLGKTVQTIALLLARNCEGPSIVVVPAAVLYNWKNEIRRFAPSLRAKVLPMQERQETLEKLQAGDVLLVTYGVLASEAELFAAQSWNVAVLDEAHTIKNRETKTSKAAMQLNAQFRLILTGTPLQNHLGEIWNLFQFINPGLLGSFQKFSERFIVPIERDHDKGKQRLLKRLIAPFILRRTKGEVLDELPEKTEIVLKVELSEAERALYENLREKAVMDLETGESTPIQALAELLKLRQAACHPRLVEKTMNLPSSKCKAFLALVEEFSRSGHRALVFSQFTSYLALVKQELDKAGIGYMYLDGSDTPAERARLVEQFQNSSVPLFLISLKAGGTGLNLTAADYVVHLDPWWNPAIEDQATDRAYRIGQSQPVTIYKLISENTIEEKIIDLHKTKKSLADALLQGTDMSHQMSREEILALLRAADEP